MCSVNQQCSCSALEGLHLMPSQEESPNYCVERGSLPVLLMRGFAVLPLPGEWGRAAANRFCVLHPTQILQRIDEGDDEPNMHDKTITKMTHPTHDDTELAVLVSVGRLWLWIWLSMRQRNKRGMFYNHRPIWCLSSKPPKPCALCLANITQRAAARRNEKRVLTMRVLLINTTKHTKRAASKGKPMKKSRLRRFGRLARGERASEWASVYYEFGSRFTDTRRRREQATANTNNKPAIHHTREMSFKCMLMIFNAHILCGRVTTTDVWLNIFNLLYTGTRERPFRCVHGALSLFPCACPFFYFVAVDEWWMRSVALLLFVPRNCVPVPPQEFRWKARLAVSGRGIDYMKPLGMVYMLCDEFAIIDCWWYAGSIRGVTSNATMVIDNRVDYRRAQCVVECTLAVGCNWFSLFFLLCFVYPIRSAHTKTTKAYREKMLWWWWCWWCKKMATCEMVVLVFVYFIYTMPIFGRSDFAWRVNGLHGLSLNRHDIVDESP